MSECRGLIKEFKDAGMRLVTETKPRRIVTHWINYVTMTVDRSFADRNTYKILKELATACNIELKVNRSTEKR